MDEEMKRNGKGSGLKKWWGMRGNSYLTSHFTLRIVFFFHLANQKSD